MVDIRYTPSVLYRVMNDERNTVPTSQWLDRYFPENYRSDQEEIVFSKLPSRRRIAPFMLPNEVGRPIYDRLGEKLTSFKPAYTKPKDAVRATEAMNLAPGEMYREGFSSPQARLDRTVADIAQFHRAAIMRLWDYMAAKSIINGAITINYTSDTPGPGRSVTVDFGRDPGHTVTLGSGSRWGDTDVSIMGLLETWGNLMALAEFGGAPRDVIVGAAAAVPLRKDPEIKELMDTTVRDGGADVNMRRGIIIRDVMNPFTPLGTIGSLTFWLYTGTFQNPDGTHVNIMDPRDIVMIAPGVEGVKAFGAIADVDNLVATDIFVKMFTENDPSARFIMSQSAPLMIPANPNRTFRARVVA